jgi:PAS domain S-box-containing protein
MAPEQTGRMNRSIDSRSDLYSLGVTLYQMLTGALPFTAADPMELVHCHIARKPVPPCERLRDIPRPVSRIVMKLMAKTAEERYQTAIGVERDLQRCLASHTQNGSIDDFPLGEQDTPDCLLIPEKLYGRQREVDTLIAAFDRIVKRGPPELVLVAGYSGIGKSSVVNELHKVLVPPRGLFAAGKFDQYKRDIPYSTLVQAFQSLVRPLLGKREMELARWRRALLEALDTNARLMTDLIPELKLVIGEPPPIPELEPQQAQRRFQLVFHRFIDVFAQPDHPLALFLDDLQWIDAATLDLLEYLLTRSDLRHLMLIGAYRNNEVDATHPLTRKLQAIEKAGGKVEEFTLLPLAGEHIAQLISDALHADPAHAVPLAQTVQEKTAGNPFFVTRFLQALADEALITFDYEAACWRWDLERIHAKGYTDNVVDLLVGKVSRLPADTQKALQKLACLGNVAAVSTLSIVLGIPEEQIHTTLREAVRQELAERLDGSYHFVHDRVQEAAYSLIPEAIRAETHLRIGRLLSARTQPEQREEVIFEIVGQLNRGAALITSVDERDQLAEYNLLAGQRAKSSTAYASALTYLNAGAALFAPEDFDRRHELIFALELNRAECEFLTGQLSAAESRLTALSMRPTTTVERALVACLQTDVCTTLDQSERAVAVCLDYLGHVGIAWSPHPQDDDERREYEHIWSLLGSRTIENLIDSPLMADAAALATVEVLSKLMPPARFTDVNLLSLTICKAVSLSLEHGNCDASCAAYVQLGRVAGPRFADFQAGARFGELGCELVERRGLKRFEASTYLCFTVFIVRWMKHVGTCRDLMRRAFDAANRVGDLTYGAYTCTQVNSNLLFAGTPLPEAQAEVELGLAYARKARFGLVNDVTTTQLALIRMLRGVTLKFGHFDDAQLNEPHFEHHLSSKRALAIGACWYWIKKLQARFMAGDYAAAMEAASKAQPLIWTSTLYYDETEYHFYSALTHAALCNGATAEEKQQRLIALAAHHDHLHIWAQTCPENFESRATLVSAEIARVEDRVMEAQLLYEQAIQSAQKNGFLQVEALAHELASRLYATLRLERIARVYLQDARYAYLRWGADGKVRQLDEMHPHLTAEHLPNVPTNTITTPVQHLDLATVIKVSQAVSSDIVVEKLIEMVMRTALEQACAERGLLILPDGGEQRIAAEATTAGETIIMRLHDEPVTQAALPESVLYYVLRTRESVILDDAVAERQFATDPYIRQCRARSILCFPLMNRAKLTGALYLENNLTTRAFTPARIAVLQLVASQAAIALENARLYRDVAEREAKIQRLVDANIIGITVWNAGGEILEANDAFLRMVGYDRADVASGRLQWSALTPPEWREVSERAVEAACRTGRAPPYEKEYIRKDGSRVPVIVGLAALEASGTKGVAFVLDLTERKRAEEEAQQSERCYREIQAELAHANRVATIGQLASSIAHEVSQPLTAMITNAEAALRWQSAQPPQLEKARRSIGYVAQDGRRAADVIGRIRALIKNAPPRKEPLDVNDAIREVIELTRREASKAGVSVQMHLAYGLPLIEGDHVELQQVILNLVINAIEAMSSLCEGVRELLIKTAKGNENCVIVAVCDTGPGFAESSAENVFKPFYTTKTSGLGMGLSICRSIIEAHDGRLWASANVPCGAVFQFTVPILGA